MESQPQNPEFRINPENFHPCISNPTHPLGQYTRLCKLTSASSEYSDEPMHVVNHTRAFAAYRHKVEM